MNTITISKKSINDDLIIISRKDLRGLLNVANKKSKTRKEELQLLSLEAKAGKHVVGPFLNTKDLYKSLGI